MSDIVPSVSNSETDAFATARARYLDLERPQPDIYDLASDVGVDPEKLYSVFIKEGWLQKRRKMQQTGLQAIEVVGDSLVKTWQESVNKAIAEMLRRDVEFIDTHKAVVIQYLDNCMLKGQLEPKDALAYLKLLHDMEKALRKIVIDEKHRGEDQNRQMLEEYSVALKDKMAALHKIVEIEQVRAGESKPAVDRATRRQRLREIK